jgi:hypothetical protein
LKAPSAIELEEMIQAAMKMLERESGGEFDTHAAAFFTTGFKLGVNAMLERHIISNMPAGKEH